MALHRPLALLVLLSLVGQTIDVYVNEVTDHRDRDRSSTTAYVARRLSPATRHDTKMFSVLDRPRP